MIVFISTGFGLGRLPALVSPSAPGAGFIGSVEGLLLRPLLPGSKILCASLITAAFLLSSWLCGRAESILGRSDDPRIILDEIVGAWIALFALPAGPWPTLSAFVLFRVFDASKLWPVSLFERLPGGWGVTADDAAAGVMANVCTRIVLMLMRGGPT